VRGRESVYGYTVNTALVDEAWGVAASVVEEGLEPTLAENLSGQLILTSTAHRKASSLYPVRRMSALAGMGDPNSTLVIEWSAPWDTQIDDREAWREASPHWSPGRERLLEARLARVEAGVSDDPDEDDPVEAFRSQFLNIWPSRRLVSTTKDEQLTDDASWDACMDLTVAPPAHGVTVAVEDFYGVGAAACAAVVLADNRILVWGDIFATRADAFAWAAFTAQTHPGARLIVGASLVRDPGVAAVGTDLVDPATTATTRMALPLVRSLILGRRLVHGGQLALSAQATGTRVVPRETGLAISGRSARTDLLRCMAWACQSVATEPGAIPFFVY
jgi:hypothetical protein